MDRLTRPYGAGRERQRELLKEAEGRRFVREVRNAPRRSTSNRRENFSEAP